MKGYSAIKIINAILERLEKDKKRDASIDLLTTDIYEIMANTRDKKTKEVLKEILQGIYNQNMTADDIIATWKEKLGTNLADELQKPLYQFTKKVYKEGIGEAEAQTGIKMSFDVTDNKAIDVMNQSNIFFIGQYYNGHNGDILKENIGRIFADAMSTKDAALQMTALIETDRNLGLNYFKGLVEHAASRIRNVANVRGYEKAGIEYAEVVAILDERTTEICKEMNGRMIPVKKMSETVNKILSIPTENRPVEEVRSDLEKVVPFWRDKDTTKVAGSKTSELLGMGAALPPYHWRCRTKTAAWFEKNTKPIKLTAGADISAETKKYYNNLTKEEIANKLATIMSMKKRYYDPVDLRGDYRHMRSFGIDDKDEYIKLANSFVDKPKYILMDVYHMMNGVKELQFSFFAAGGYTVINQKGYIKGCFKQRDIDKCIYNVKDKYVMIEDKNGDN